MNLVPWREGFADQHICYPKRILSLPIRFLPGKQRCPPHISSSTPHQLRGKATRQPIAAHPFRKKSELLDLGDRKVKITMVLIEVIN